MLQLGQLDLQLALVTLGAQREDVENQRSAIDHPAFEQAFEVALLAGRQFVVKDDQIGFVGAQGFGQLGRLALANIERRIGRTTLGAHHCLDVRAGAGGQQSELGQALFDRALTEIDLHEDRPLAVSRAVKHAPKLRSALHLR